VVSDFSFGQFRFLDRLILHHGRWFYYRLSYFFIFFGWKNVIITFIIFYFLTESAFSGTFNYTEPCYLLYNSFFGIVMLVYFGLYDQDANDDLEPALWKHLPEIYAQTKKKELFSYRRYFTWFGIGILMSLFIYFILRLSVGADVAVDGDGHVEDLAGFKLLHGLALVLVVTLVNYIDTRTRTYFFEVIIFFVCTALATASFYIAENYLPIMGYFNDYTDNLNLRFWLTIFLVVTVVYMVKIAAEFYLIDESPSILDKYAIAKD
jgi:phospholipid-translocating ATPase